MNPSATVAPGLVARARRAWLHFWFAPSPPEALGLARAFFFGALFLVYAREDFAGWGAVDRVFWQPIWLFRILGLGPAAPATLSILQIMFRSSLLLAAVGLFTRPAAIAACVLGTYLFGLPHNFGHTYHFDALLVFVFLIVACSRAGDGVSLDGRRRRITPAAGPEYTWPIRLVWVAMSLVFFAAGLSKLRHGGLEWVASNNLSIVLTKAHYHVSDADPIGPWGLWIASSPLASRALAFVSLATETLFPLALLGRVPRAVLVPAAFGMIVGIRILMGPTFGGFLTVFAFWVPWTAILVWARARSRARYVMLFDGSCGLCQHTVQIVRRLDILDRIDVFDVARGWPAAATRYPALSRDACLDEMHVMTPRGKVELGYAAYRAMARAIPAAWPIVPLLYLPGAAAVGDRVYRAVARRRASNCAVERESLRPFDSGSSQV